MTGIVLDTPVGLPAGSSSGLFVCLLLRLGFCGLSGCFVYACFDCLQLFVLC